MPEKYSNFENQVIALSAATQAAELVDSIARNGWCNSARATELVNSLFIFEPENASDIYPNLDSLRPGLKNLRDILSKGAQQEHQNTVRYILGMVQLASLLQKQKDLSQILHNRLLSIAPGQHNHESETDDKGIYHGIANAYLDTLATMKFRVQVTGNPLYLKDTDNTDKIRTFLLAGVRASMLWYQLGGSRLKLIFFRKKLIKTVDKLLA